MSADLVPFDYIGPQASCDAEAHIYVVAFDGTPKVKVGRTAQPTTRIRAHARTANLLGSRISAWVSGPHIESGENERQLINWCQDRTGTPRRKRSEYFEIPFGDVVAFAKSLPMERADVEAYKAKTAAATDLFKSFIMGGAR